MADAVQRLYPGHQGHVRPRGRERLLLRLRSQGRPLQRSRLRAHRSRDARDHRGRLSVPARGGRRKDDARTLLVDRWARPTRSSISSGSQGEISLYRHGDWVDLCEGPHVPSTGFSARGEADLGRRRVLARRRAQPDAAAHLRHGVPVAERARRVSARRRRGASARDHRKLGKELELIGFHRSAPASPFFLPRGAQRLSTRCSTTCATLYRSLRLYQKSSRRRSSTTSCSRPSGHLPTYAANMFFAHDRRRLAERAPRRSRSSPARRRRCDPASNSSARAALRHQADELPGPLPDVRHDAPQLSRAADAHRRLRSPASLSSARRGAGPDPRAHVLPG